MFVDMKTNLFHTFQICRYEIYMNLLCHHQCSFLFDSIEIKKNVYGEKENMNIFPLNDIPSDDEWYGYVMKNLAEKSKNFGKVQAFYCGGIDEGKWFDKGELKIEMLDISSFDAL